MKPSKIIESLRFGISNNLPVLLTGSPGVGKTSMVEQVAKDLGYEVIVECLSISDPLDFKGALFHEDGRAEFLPAGSLNRIINTDKKILYFLDDIGQGAPATQAAAMQLIQGRRVGKYEVGKNVVFIGATNGAEDMAGVAYLLEPLKGRFATILPVDVNLDDWIKWANRNEMPFELVAFIQFKPDMLNDFKPTKELKNSPTPRTVAKVGQMINFGIPKDLQYEMFSGACGESFAIEFTSFLDVYKSLPRIEDILRDPHNFEISDKLDVKFAVMAALSKVLKVENFDNACIYLKRLGEEFMISAVKNAFDRDYENGKSELFSSTQFQKWAAEYSPYLT